MKKEDYKKNYSYRTDEKTKKDFDAVCKAYGISSSGAIAMYVSYVARAKEMPAVLLKIQNEAEEAK